MSLVLEGSEKVAESVSRSWYLMKLALLRKVQLIVNLQNNCRKFWSKKDCGFIFPVIVLSHPFNSKYLEASFG